MASATYYDVPVVIDGYEAAKERQRYLIEQMETLDMTLWLARIPSDQRFHYPGKLIRDDDDNMETEILDIMREIESLQEIVDIYEDVDEDLEWEVDEEALREFERLTRGRKAELTIPIPEGALSRNPSPCSSTWVPRPVESEFDKTFNPFREEYFLGLEDAIIDETEFITIPGGAPHPLSTISHNSLFGDLVDYVREWNPFDIGSPCTSRSSSMDSTFSFNEMISESSVSSDAGDDCSVRKTSDESTKTSDVDRDTEMTVPLVLDDGRFKAARSRRSSSESQNPWPEYLECGIDVDEEMDYDDYYEYEEMVHQNLVHYAGTYADLGSSLLNSTFESFPTDHIVCTERALSECSTISDSEPCTPTTISPHMIHIELPAYKIDYYLAFEDAEDQFIRTKFLDSAVDFDQQFPSFESVLSTFDPSFETKTFQPPMMFQHNASMETLDLDDPMDILESQRVTASFARDQVSSL